MIPGSVIARTAVLLPATMAAWWFLLKRPSLWLLEKLAYIPLGLLIAPGGSTPIQVDPLTHDWTFNVAVNAYTGNGQTTERQWVDSVQFTTDEDSLAYFASGWWAYLALAAAAGALTRAELPRVAKGLSILTAVNILSVVAFAYINGYGSVINSPGGGSGRVWLLKYCYHLVYLVVPFAGPFAVAVLQHRRWRECFGSFADPLPRRKTSQA